MSTEQPLQENNPTKSELSQKALELEGMNMEAESSADQVEKDRIIEKMDNLNIQLKKLEEISGLSEKVIMENYKKLTERLVNEEVADLIKEFTPEKQKVILTDIAKGIYDSLIINIKSHSPEKLAVAVSLVLLLQSPQVVFGWDENFPSFPPSGGDSSVWSEEIPNPGPMPEEEGLNAVIKAKERREETQVNGSYYQSEQYKQEVREIIEEAQALQVEANAGDEESRRKLDELLGMNPWLREKMRNANHANQDEALTKVVSEADGSKDVHNRVEKLSPEEVLKLKQKFWEYSNQYNIAMSRLNIFSENGMLQSEKEHRQQEFSLASDQLERIIRFLEEKYPEVIRGDKKLEKEVKMFKGGFSKW